MKKLFVCLLCGILLLPFPGCQSQTNSSLPSASASSKEERPWSSKAGITNFTAFNGYFVVEILDPGASGISFGWLEQEEGKDCYTLENVHPYSFGQVERATCFEAYEKDGEDYLFTQTGFYKVSKDSVEELRSFPAQRYASVQYNHSLRAFLYIDLLDRSLYLEPLEGEPWCICEGRFIEDGASLQGKNPYNPNLLAYPLEARLSEKRILCWYFHEDGERTLRVYDLEGNLLSETDRIGPLPCNPEWWGNSFLGEDTFLLWWLETETDEANNYIYTTHFTLYDQSFQEIQSMDIPYGVDPYSTVRPGFAGQTFYVIGSTSHEGATAIKEHAIEVRLGEKAYEVLAEDEFIPQIKPEEDRLYYLNAKNEIWKVVR